MADFFDLSTLDGSNGFIINGLFAGSRLGQSVSSAGDINGDGIADIVIGADATSVLTNPGAAYVLFGRSGEFSSNISLNSLNGSNGFAIRGRAIDDSTGFSVSNAGDVNGDGITDLIVGARFADVRGKDSGESFVIFGRRGGFPAEIRLDNLGGNGFTIPGIAADDRSGRAVSGAGDVNGDGVGDFLVGATLASTNLAEKSGQVYVVFGNRNFPPELDLLSLNGSNGFAIDGINSGDDVGFSISRAGDVNRDGFADLIIGAPGARNGTGQAYVIFGRAGGFPKSLEPETLNGSNGFIINGIARGDQAGRMVSSAGDLNQDGFADLLIGARAADPNGNLDAGQAYVVFGSAAGFPAQLNLADLNGRNGFAINGVAGDALGSSGTGIGDFNGDGLNDLIVGAPGADTAGRSNPGRAYIIFGRSGGFPATVDVANLTSAEGIVLNGVSPNALTGRSLDGIGDFNNDGVADILIGAPNATVRGSNVGQAYVLFGRAGERPLESNFGLKLTPPLIDASGVTVGSISVDLAAETLVINRPQPIRRTVTGFTNVIGTALNDRITGSAATNSLVGGSGDDTLLGAEGNDTLVGGTGHDTLQGGSGNDKLVGNEGNDRLRGGPGRDRFIFDLNARFQRQAMGVDRVLDFRRGQDKIVLDRTTFRTLKRGRFTSFKQVQNRRQAQRSDAQFTYIRRTGSLFYNANGERNGFGSGGLFADFRNGLNLTSSDFAVRP
ncbi:MAG: FG-GAP repeat protein [Synechococcales cyanobacterium C42_A2020_086]|jgi:Ca2+-binding RTX toxin-like protein|nr:FG-GAP repeat protein [Synechococcales cyanobacterium C42_A2020_086]